MTQLSQNQFANNHFDRLVGLIQPLPLWVKQVLFVRLRDELEGSLTKSTVDALGQQDMLPLLVPQLTVLGEQVVTDASKQVSERQRVLLQACYQQKPLLEICMMTGWSLAQCCHLILEAMVERWMQPPPSQWMLATMAFLAGKIRLGEYLVKINRIELEQLDQALRTQHCIKSFSEDEAGIADILINLGYLNKKDVEGILFLKEESRKPFPSLTLPHA